MRDDATIGQQTICLQSLCPGHICADRQVRVNHALPSGELHRDFAILCFDFFSNYAKLSFSNSSNAD